VGTLVVGAAEMQLGPCRMVRGNASEVSDAALRSVSWAWQLIPVEMMDVTTVGVRRGRADCRLFPRVRAVIWNAEQRAPNGGQSGTGGREACGHERWGGAVGVRGAEITGLGPGWCTKGISTGA
jgi:hypothetical protein